MVQGEVWPTGTGEVMRSEDEPRELLREGHADRTRTQPGSVAQSLISFNRMRRGFHIAIALLALVALARPFDCFGATFSKKAAECCHRGKCLPTKDADECCKATVPSGNQLTAPKSPDHSTELPAILASEAPVVLVAPTYATVLDEAHAPPGSPPGSRFNLPLLI